MLLVIFLAGLLKKCEMATYFPRCATIKPNTTGSKSNTIIANAQYSNILGNDVWSTFFLGSI